MKKNKLVFIGGLLSIIGALFWGIDPAQAGPGGGTYYANSPAGGGTGTALRKFVDSLPGLGLPGCNPLTTCNANNLGQYIPIANPDTTTYSGSDYYEIGLKDYRAKMHSDLPVITDGLGSGTKLRGYYQKNNGNGLGGTTDHSSQYLGPVILATKNRPVRVKFVNELGLSNTAAGKLFIPVDTTIMGAGLGPLGAGAGNYTENRATLHLHGGLTPWISDGTPHQWITPANDPTSYKKGMSFQNVPDMVGPGKSIPSPAANDGLATFYWTNQQTNRLMFYHDHAYGITRLNVYAGEAAGYVLTDPQEETLITAGTIPNICTGGGATLCEYRYGIPLVIQDKTWVPQNISTQDAKWTNSAWGPNGDLWFPHVYEPNQDPTSEDGLNPLGRWDYGPYVFPPTPVANLTLPEVSQTPEAFMDTPIVNGTAYPYIPVERRAYRFRFLAAANDRSFNLQLYYADSGYTTAATATATVANGQVTAIILAPGGGGAGYTPDSRPMVHILGGGGFGAWATAEVNGAGVVTDIVLTNGGSGYTSAPTISIGGNTEVKMVPANGQSYTVTELNNLGVPVPVNVTVPGDNRDGGVPDPTSAGPQMIQIGTEGGFLPAPVFHSNRAISFDGVGNVADKTLLLMPAERADVIIDFSGAPANSRIILYSDAPAALPGGDPRYDYYTGDPDQTASGGAPQTLIGYGPNTRTIMQFQVSSGAAATAFNRPALQTGLSAAYTASQDPPVVPEVAYGAPTNTYAKLLDTSMTIGSTNFPFKGKSINEGFEPNYGRITATLGLQDPSGLTAAVPMAYTDPITERVFKDGTQLWKITHNGVDSHPIHFHLLNVQVVNRIGFDGSIRPPADNELGWKETVRMNPQEEIIVAFKAKAPTLPFPIPISSRPLDVTQPVSATNPLTSFGYEYVWHCHILGHEELDLMRPLVLNLNSTKGDFNNDGNVDLLWRNNTTGEVDVWYMTGATYGSGAVIVAAGAIPLNWTIIGTGDFNGDGQTDLLWRNNTTGEVDVWYMTGATYGSGAVIVAAGAIPLNWTIIGTGDFNGDGQTDLLWRNNTTGEVDVWYMTGATYSSGATIVAAGAIPLNWTIIGTGDFNGDGQTDLLWRNNTTGEVDVWYMTGATYGSGATIVAAGAIPLNWTIIGTGDFNGDGQTDLLWRNNTTGEVDVWYMTGATYGSGATIVAAGAIPLNWVIK